MKLFYQIINGKIYLPIQKSILKLLVHLLMKYLQKKSLTKNMILKIASCSSTDWPLVEKIYSLYRKKRKKILISLGGLNEREISRVFSYFNNRNVDFNFLYCVAKYPSNSEDLIFHIFQN